jgi:hypothetical protein
MAEVERSWFRRVLQREPGAPYIWYDPAIEDSEMVPMDGAVQEAGLAAWQAGCQASRKAAAAHSLSGTGLTGIGEPCSLRGIYVHMIEEYARHNGHADLIRELTDRRLAGRRDSSRQAPARPRSLPQATGPASDDRGYFGRGYPGSGPAAVLPGGAGPQHHRAVPGREQLRPQRHPGDQPAGSVVRPEDPGPARSAAGPAGYS